MLKYTFYYPDDMIRDIDAYFDHNYDDKWFDDPFVREMVEGVDKTKVLSSTAAESPVFGIMPITKISGGVKALILMLKQDRPIWSPACGDNCTEYMIQIGDKRDYLIHVNHYLKFPRDFTAECVDNGIITYTAEEFTDMCFGHFAFGGSEYGTRFFKR